MALRAPQHGPVRLTNSTTLDYTTTPNVGVCFDVSDTYSSPYSASRVSYYRHGVIWRGGKARFSMDVRTHSNSAVAADLGYAIMHVSVAEEGVNLRTYTERAHVPIGFLLHHTFHVDFLHKPRSSSGVTITVTMGCTADFGPLDTCEVSAHAASLTIQPVE